MTKPTLSAIVATIVSGAARLKHRHELARRHACVISYIEGMPAYLRNDIGLPPGADIRQIVDRGRVGEASDRDVRRNLGIMTQPI